MPREAELYASAVLPSGETGISCPGFFGLSEGPGGGVGIWLELVEGRAAGEWTAETFAQIAEHVGQFTRSCPPETVTAARRVPPRDLCARSDLMQRSLELLDQHCNDRLVRQVYPGDISRGLHQLWERRIPLAAAVASAPRGVCHGDAQRNNLLPRSSRRTTAIDWANLATAPIGLDAATLFHYALAYFDFDVEHADGLDKAIFNGYLRGLGATGEAQTAAIRLTYCTQLALGLGLLEVEPVLRMITDHDRREAAETFYRRPLQEILNRRHHLAGLLLDLGREALSNSKRPWGRG
nr:phosphotransferase [Kribbella speibonae]